MPPRARLNDIETPAPAAKMAHAILVRRRRRLARREAR